MSKKIRAGDCFYRKGKGDAYYLVLESGYISVHLYRNGDGDIGVESSESLEDYASDLTPSTLGEFMTAFRTAKTAIDNAVSQVTEDLDKMREGA